MTDVGRDAPPSWLALAIVAAVACGVHAGSLSASFTYDDVPLVLENPAVTGNAGLGTILATPYWGERKAGAGLYRPLTTASYRLNFLASGREPWSYHLLNVLLHGAVTALVLLVGRRLSGSTAAAGAAALLFATHPIHVEAVASVVGRAELLAAMFVLAAWRLRERTWISAGLFACALLSKENAVVLPALLLLEDLFRARTASPARRYLPFLAVIALFAATRIAVLGVSIAPTDGPFALTPPLHRMLTAVAVIGKYLALMIWPANLTAIHHVPVVTDPANLAFLLGTAALAACLALAWASRVKLPAVSCGVLLFLIALAPVSNIAVPIGVAMAERLLYLPSAGLCVAAGAALAALGAAAGRRRPIAATTAMAVLLASPLAIRSWTRTREWSNNLVLFEATARSTPQSENAHIGLGSAYEAAGRWSEAEAAYRKAIAIAPDNPKAHYNLGVILQRSGRRSEAISEYEDVVRADPHHRKALNNLGVLLIVEGRPREAVEILRRAVEDDPDSHTPAVNLASAYLHAGIPSEAERILRDVLAAHPDDPAALRVLDALRRRANSAPGAAAPDSRQPER